MRILISGAGIAGLTLSYSLLRRGDHEITVVEKSPAIRGEGYMIDFFGAGYVAAERLGLIPDLERIHFPIRRIEFADSQGRDKFGGLVGDACHCVSLVAGQGASLAMAGAYVLAEELSRGVLGVPGALKAYERRVKPGVERIQIAGRRIARWFVPQSWFGLAIRNGLTRVATWPLARNIVGASMADSILQ